MKKRTLVVSDVHGCRKTFNKCLIENKFTKKDRLVVIGDIIDRGPDSKGVVDDILALMDAGYDVQCVKGNHEDMMFVTTARFDGLSLWLQNGGGECLVSYGINKVPQDGPYGTARFPENYLDMIPQRHKDFFESLPVYLVIDDYIFVHGGLNFYLDNALKTPKDDMMWERMSMKYRSDSVSGKKVVFGHTPRAKSQIELDKDKDCIVIDNGCVFGHESEFKYGSLCCLTIEKKGTRTLTFTKKCDNVQDDANPRFL